MGVWYNPLVTWLLRSPLRRTMDGSTLLLTYTGRKTGQPHTFPISYGQHGERVRVMTAQPQTWWKNLGQGAPVTLWLRGRRRTGHAAVTPLEREARVTAMLEVYRGMPRRLAEQQADTIVVVDIQLDPAPNGARPA